MTYVVVDTREYDLDVHGPFQAIEDAEQYARRILELDGRGDLGDDFDVYGEEAAGVDVVELTRPSAPGARSR